MPTHCLMVQILWTLFTTIFGLYRFTLSCQIDQTCIWVPCGRRYVNQLVYNNQSLPLIQVMGCRIKRNTQRRNSCQRWTEGSDVLVRSSLKGSLYYKQNSRMGGRHCNSTRRVFILWKDECIYNDKTCVCLGSPPEVAWAVRFTSIFKRAEGAFMFLGLF